MDTPERESIEFDVVIVGAGPSGLSAACQIKKQAAEQGKEVNVCVLEKGAEVGAHRQAAQTFNTLLITSDFL